MNEGVRRALGCGCGSVLAMVMAIILVGVGLFSFGPANKYSGTDPLPENIPPLRGEEVPIIDVHAPGRTSLKLGFWAEPIAKDTGIPVAALQAYGNAELIAAQAWPECHLSWTTLAGIGWVETQHGSYSGKVFSPSKINAEGYVEPPIVGPALDGSNGFMEIRDTDNGELDGDTEFDRAVGPMQFIPTTWARFGRDANGDGRPDPQQIDDAALSAAHLLCAGRNLSDPEEWRSAIHAYNQSTEYMLKVRNAANAYAERRSVY